MMIPNIKLIGQNTIPKINPITNTPTIIQKSLNVRISLRHSRFDSPSTRPSAIFKISMIMPIIKYVII